MCNLNTFSQIFRIVLGLLLITLAWLGPETSILDFEWIELWNFGWLGIIPLISGIAAFCPVYAVFGCGHKHDHEQKTTKQS